MFSEFIIWLHLRFSCSVKKKKKKIRHHCDVIMNDLKFRELLTSHSSIVAQFYIQYIMLMNFCFVVL